MKKLKGRWRSDYSVLQQSNICIFVLLFNIQLLEYIDISIYYLCSIHLWTSVSLVLFALYFLLISFLWCTIYCLFSFIIEDKFIFCRKLLTSKFQALPLSFGREKEQTQLIAYQKKKKIKISPFYFLKVLSVHKHLWNNLSLKNFIEFFKLHPAANSKMPIWHFVMLNSWEWQNFLWASRLFCIQCDLTDVWSQYKPTGLTYMSRVTSEPWNCHLERLSSFQTFVADIYFLKVKIIWVAALQK